jgi:hypothetical protein
MHWAAFFSALLLLSGAMSSRVLAQADDADENAAGARAAAGSYTEDMPDKDQENKKGVIGAILISGKFADAAEQAKFDAYYKTYFLPRWTQLSNLNNLYKFRTRDLYSNLRNAKGQVHDHLNDLVLEYMDKLAKSDKYHPTVRVNAMLTIGDLNSVDSVQPTQNVPLAAALPLLLAAVSDANQVVPVKIAALVGINRHVTAGVNDPQIQNQILSTLLKLVDVADAVDSSDEGHRWMRKQAIEILGLSGNLGDKNQVVLLLSGIVSDAKAAIGMRCAAAEALGKLKYANASGLNPLDLAKPLGQLMRDSCADELAGGTEAKLDTYGHLLRIKARLGTVNDGLKGVKQLAKEQPQQTYLNEFQSILDNFLKELDKLDTKSRDNLNKDDLQKPVADCQAKLETWLAKKP